MGMDSPSDTGWPLQISPFWSNDQVPGWSVETGRWFPIFRHDMPSLHVRWVLVCLALI